MTETKEKISEAGVANSSAVVHPAGTVVMSRTASVGFSAILGTDMATSQDYVTWTCGPEADPRYVLHSLRGLRDEILGMRMGSTHQTIYMPDVERIRIPLPPLRQQRRIASFLDTETARVDALIETKKRMVSLSKARLRRSTSEMLGMALGEEKPRRCPLRYAARISGGLTLGKSYPQEEERFPYLRVANVQDGWLDLSDVATVAIPRDQAARFALREGDLLVLEGNGNPQNLGRGTLWRGELSGLVLHQNHVHVVRPDEGLLPEYLDLVLRTEVARDHFTGGSSQVSIATLSQERLGELPIPLPTIEEQQSLVGRATAELRRVGDLAATLTRQIEALKERRQALITAAVTGEIEV